MSDETYNQILWLESLRDAIEDGQIQEAIDSIEAAIKLLKRQRDGE